MLKAFSLVEATKKLPYDITAFDAWSKWINQWARSCYLLSLAPQPHGAGSKSSDGKRDEKFFIVCWDKCHAATYRLKEGESEVLSEWQFLAEMTCKDAPPKRVFGIGSTCASVLQSFSLFAMEQSEELSPTWPTYCALALQDQHMCTHTYANPLGSMLVPLYTKYCRHTYISIIIVLHISIYARAHMLGLLAKTLMRTINVVRVLWCGRGWCYAMHVNDE